MSPPGINIAAQSRLTCAVKIKTAHRGVRYTADRGNKSELGSSYCSAGARQRTRPAKREGESESVAVILPAPIHPFGPFSHQFSRQVHARNPSNILRRPKRRQVTVVRVITASAPVKSELTSGNPEARNKLLTWRVPFILAPAPGPPPRSVPVAL